MQYSPLAVLSVLMLTAAVASARMVDDGPYAPYVEEARPFDQGDAEISLGFGFESRGEGSAYLLGGAFSYYVLPGLAPGVDITHHGGAGADQTWMLMTVKWVLYRSRKVSPYVVGQGGRIARYSGLEDLWIAGAGPGVHFFSSGGLGLFLQMIVYRLSPSDLCEECWGRQIGLGVSFAM